MNDLSTGCCTLTSNYSESIVPFSRKRFRMDNRNVSKSMKNPLLQTASFGFPIENVLSSNLIVPVASQSETTLPGKTFYLEKLTSLIENCYDSVSLLNVQMSESKYSFS